MNSYQKNAIEDEIFITQKIKSEHIVKIDGAREDSSRFYIFMEKCDGSLKKIILNKFSVSVTVKIDYLAQIVQGLCDLSKAQCLHRELNPDNVLIKGNTVKLTSNGHFKFYLKEMTENNDNVYYVSPQILRSRPYSSKADIFSVGVIAYQLLQGGELPWGRFTDTEEYVK